MKELNRKPTAKVSLKKNVLKIYNVDNQDVVYLPKNAEFEIELFNPTLNRILAKIELNNKVISGGGIVLKPGERIFLERYIDDDKKFLFETYEVDSDIEDIKSIISNNGLVTVTFYEEQNNTFWTNTAWYDMRPRYYLSQPTVVYTANCTSGSSIGTTCFAADLNLTSTSIGNTGTATSTTSTEPITRSGKKSIETGIISKGEQSNQEFTNVNYNFNSYHLNKVSIKILPDSQKLVSSEDLKHKKYCSECGSKLKNTDKFCSNCGTKL